MLFENVTGYDIPLVIGLFASAKRMAWALGVEDLDELAGRIQGLLNMMQGPPEGLVDRLRMLGQLVHLGSFQPKTLSQAPCQDVVIDGDDVNLFKYPVIKCWPLDGGRYIIS